MYNELLKRVAAGKGVSEDEVRKEIEKAIAEAYKSPSAEALNVPRNGDIPTVEEFLSYAIEQANRV